jgi:hypothetical protein
LKETTIKSIMESNDPLSSEAIQFLLDYKEEDIHVDYKECFNKDEEKHWLGLTSDAMAFANTYGGFIVYGVKDKGFDIVGMDQTANDALTDTNLLLQKLNRYVLPHFAHIRTKSFVAANGIISVIYVPESKGKTHIYVKDVSYKFPSGITKPIIWAGMIFIRRSATNHIADPEDLEFIVNKRIEFYKDSILSKITKVIEAPPDHQVLIFGPDSKKGEGETFSISDSPDAIPVKGMSFTIVPRSDVEEVAGWISLSKRDLSFAPSNERLWKFYTKRKEIKLNRDQLIEIVRFSILEELPVFYWLNSLSRDDIKTTLLKIFNGTKKVPIKTNMLSISSFLGKTFYNKILKKMDSDKGRIGFRMKSYPSSPFACFHPDIIESQKKGGSKFNENEFRKKQEIELDRISISIAEKSGGVYEKMVAKAIDCYLYARTDKYK